MAVFTINARVTTFCTTSPLLPQNSRDYRVASLAQRLLREFKSAPVL